MKAGDKARIVVGPARKVKAAARLPESLY